MIILGIETSCDETAVSLIEATQPATQSASTSDLQVKILAHTLISQIKIHEPYGGVFPMLAKREHGKNLIPLLHKVIAEAKIAPKKVTATSSENILKILEREPELAEQFKKIISDQESSGQRPAIDAIAVTEGPGLEPALWVGVSFANALGQLWQIPVIPVNHMEGHIVASLIHEDSKEKITPLTPPPLPAITLLISGGHTELILIEKIGTYTLLGQTRDDAVGEAFDKVARLLGLPYPGGPEISRLAAEDEHLSHYPLPRPMIHSKDLDFSFSGLKTAVLYLLKDLREKGHEITSIDRTAIAHEFETAVTEVLVSKTRTAIDTYSAQSLIVGGGVIANKSIRKSLTHLAEEFSIPIFLPDTIFSTDNALMIAVAGALHMQEISVVPMVQGNLRLHKE